MNDLTLENFHEKTGFRFRVSNEKLKPRKPEEVCVLVIIVTMLFCLPVILFMVCKSFNDYISQ